MISVLFYIESNMGISYCIPIHNEASTLTESLRYIQENLSSIMGEENYEIIFVENGSKDDTEGIIKKLRSSTDTISKNVRYLYIQQKGYGAAAKTGILEASSELVCLTAIDIPFGFDDLKQALPLLNGYDVVFGSKAHKKSIINYPLKRKLASYIYRFLVRLLFNLKVKDPQGTIFFRKSAALPILDKCDASNAFFTTQLAIYCNKAKLKMTEIPVVLPVNRLKRESQYSVVRDGSDMLKSILNEYKKIHHPK